MIGSLGLGMILGLLTATAFAAVAGGGFWSWLAVYMLSGTVGTLVAALRQVACREAREPEILSRSH